MLNHGEAKAVLIDREFSAVMREALAKVDHPVLVIDVDDSEYAGPGERIGELDYETPARKRRSGVRVDSRHPTNGMRSA